MITKRVAENLTELFQLIDESLENIYITIHCEEELNQWLEEVIAVGDADVAEKLAGLRTIMFRAEE
jgi:hypothetical protein